MREDIIKSYNINKDTKLLFFDIDGTLITDDGNRTLPDSTIEAIKLARANNCLTFINTGRVFCNVEQWIRDIGFDGYVCGCGSYIRLGDETLYHIELPQEVCRRIAYDCRKYGMYALFEHETQTCYDKEMKDPARDVYLNYFAENLRKLVDDIEDPEFRFDKFAAWYNKDSDIEGFKESISPYFNYIDREGDFCELERIGHSKATGIKFLLDYLGLPLHNAYVFGDGNNDLEMMRFVENSICMRSGSELAKQTASYITDSVLDNGIYNAMKHFEII